MFGNKETKIRVRKMLGSQTPFYQGGSLRIVLPKSFAREHSKSKQLDEQPYVFLETDKGLLMTPLEEYIASHELRGETFASLKGMTTEDIVRLINEMADDKEFE